MSLYDLFPLSNNLNKNNNVLELKNPSTINIISGNSTTLNFFDITDFNSQLLYLIQLKETLITDFKIISNNILTKQNTIDITSPYTISITINNISGHDIELIFGDLIAYIYPIQIINIGLGPTPVIPDLPNPDVSN
jgi:hypothetical protein